MGRQHRGWRGAFLVALCIAGAGPARASTLQVANNGVDSGGCGGKTAPCRSIGRAIGNAVPGDKIVVGPGHYGDLDADGSFGGAGEESGSPAAMIVVDRPLTIESRDGASATVIDATDAARDAVAITANGVVFGKAKKGFLVRGASGFTGITVSGNGVVVRGNRASGNGGGFLVLGGDFLLAGNQAAGNAFCGATVSGSGRVLGNELIQNTGGGLCTLIGSYEIAGNVAIGNGASGISVGGFDNVLKGNVASDNLGAGFDLAGNATITGNVASRNADSGFFLNGGDHVVTGNSAVGNGAYGMEIPSNAGPMTLVKNNFVGNDRRIGGLRCGLYNFSGNSIDATQSFWGAPTGPGPAPADEACNDTSVAEVFSVPFATKEVKVKTKPPVIQ